MPFAPRRRKNYVTLKNGRYYYRRVIPERFRHLFGGKTVWVIPLEGRGMAELEAEAMALAHRHNQQMSFAEPLPENAFTPEPDDVAMMIDLASPDRPSGAPEPSPMFFLRDGVTHEVFRFAVTSDAAIRRKAEADGYFAMTPNEFAAQMDFHANLLAFREADTEERREIADLKGERAARQIEDAEKQTTETVLSILPRWRAQEGQAHATWKKHVQYATEFAELHSDLPLSAITKRHVVSYVEHAQSLTYRDKPLSPTSITKRLDTIRALLSFAVSADEIAHNPATGVKPPKDTRPKTSRSWKSFDSDEVVKLERVATSLWNGRRAGAETRAADLTVALRALIWTGARPEEICQLRRGDVDLSRQCIRITNDESDDDARARTTKNEHSIREVPIHPRLTAVLANHLRTHNSPLLFPTFEPHPTPKEIAAAKRTGKPVEITGRYSRPITREWTDNLRHKITDGDPRKVLYSLRHSWAAESRRTGMPEHVRNALMGHADDNPHAGRYGGDADWLDEKRKHIEAMSCLRESGEGQGAS